MGSDTRGRARRRGVVHLQAALVVTEGSDDRLGAVLLDDVLVVKHVELVRGVLSGKEENGLGTAGVVVEESGDVENLSVHDDPAVVLGVVFGNLLLGELLLSSRGGSSSRSGGGGGRSGSRRGGDRGGSSRRSTESDLNVDLLGAGVDRHLDSFGDVGGSSSGRGELEEASGGGGTGDTSEDDTLEKGGSSETVDSVDSSSDLTTGVESGDLSVGLGGNLGVSVDGDTSHAVVNDGGHNTHVASVAEGVGAVGEELLAEGVLLLLGELVVLVEGGLEGRGGDAHVLGEVGSRLVVLHDTTASVVLDVPSNLVRGGGVEDETERSLVLPHLSGDVVTTSEFVTETLAVGIDEETTDTAESLGGEELDLGIGLSGVDDTGGVDLDPVQINVTGTDFEGHLETISGTVGSVGGGEVGELGAELADERVLSEVGTESTGGNHDGSMGGEGLAILDVLDSDNVSVVGDEFGGLGLGEDLGAVSSGLDLLDLLHESVCDGHTGELGGSTVGTGVRVTSETAEEREVETELLHEPGNSGAGVVSEDLGELSGLLSFLSVVGRGDSVLEENLRVVSDTVDDLGLGEGSVDSRSSLGGVTSHEGILLKEKDLATALEHGVGSRETRKASSNNNNLSHVECEKEEK